MMEKQVFRKEFPVVNTYLYLDHAGIAPVSNRVVHAALTYLRESAEGGAFQYPRWMEKVMQVRRSTARLVNARESEIAFVRSTSHGLSLVAEGLDWNRQDNVVIYGREFPSNLFPWMHAERKGIEVRTFRTQNGRIAIEDIDRMVDRRTRIISISAVQFTNGFRVDLEKLGAYCKEKNVLLCVDAIQGLGAIPIDVRQCNIEFLAADAHKWLLGPEGIGIFYCSERMAKRLQPVLTGWKSVRKELAFEEPEFRLKENALRFEEGSMNLVSIFGLGAALEMILEAGIERIENDVLSLGDRIISLAEERQWTVLTPKDRKERAGIITLKCAMDAEMMREELRRQKILVNVRGGGLRVSPHFYNTDEDIDRLFDAMDRISGRIAGRGPARTA